MFVSHQRKDGGEAREEGGVVSVSLKRGEWGKGGKASKPHRLINVWIRGKWRRRQNYIIDVRL